MTHSKNEFAVLLIFAQRFCSLYPPQAAIAKLPDRINIDVTFFSSVRSKFSYPFLKEIPLLGEMSRSDKRVAALARGSKSLIWGDYLA